MNLHVIHLQGDPSLEHLTDKEYMLLPPGKWNTGPVCMMIKRTEGPHGRYKKLGFLTHNADGTLDQTLYVFGSLPGQPDDPPLRSGDFDTLHLQKERFQAIKFDDLDVIIADGWEVD